MDDFEHGVLAAATFLLVEVASTFDRETANELFVRLPCVLARMGRARQAPKSLFSAQNVQ